MASSMAVQHSLHDDLNLSYSKRENVEAKFSLSRRRRSRRRDYAMMLERGLGGWCGMGWCCWWNWTTSDDNDDDDTRFASRLSSFPCLLACLLLLFSSILLLVYSYRVPQSLSLFLCLASFFLSLSFFAAFIFGEGDFFLHARCVLRGFARVFSLRVERFFSPKGR